MFDPGSGEAHVLNRTGAYLWSLCDGTRSFGALVSALAKAYSLDVVTARKDAAELLDNLERAGLITFAG